MVSTRQWMERDAWAYGGGREQAKVGRKEGRVKYETPPTLRDKKQTESKASPAQLGLILGGALFRLE